MAQRFDTRSALSTLLVALACAVACAGIWSVDGIISTRAGGDSPFLLIRTQQLLENITSGAVPARWMPDAAFGLGYPFFTYYAALPYYVAAAIALLGLDMITALKLTQTLGIVAAAFAMRACARDWLPELGAALAAIAYTFAPFHLANVYVRGDALSELWAFVWFPLVLAGITRLCRAEAPTIGGLLRIALPLAGLVLTHNVSTLLFAPCAVVWTLACALERTSKRGPERESGRAYGRTDVRRSCGRTSVRLYGALTASALLAAGLTAWFWLPALGEASQAQLGEQTTGYFNYATHFRELGLCAPRFAPPTCAETELDPAHVNLVQASLISGFSDSDSLRAFALNPLQLLLVLAGAGAWFASPAVPGRQRLGRALALGLMLLSTLMITPLSEPLWRLIKPLQIAQFPWRWLSVQSVFAALLIGAIAHARRGGTPLALAASAVSIALPALALITTPGPRALNVRPDEINSRNIQRFEWFSGIIGTTIRHEYFPATVLPAPAVGPDLLGLPRAALIAQDGAPASALQSTLLTSEPEEQEWLLRVDADSLALTLPLIYSPAWTAIDSGTGASVALSPYVGSGWVGLTLPRGEHIVRLTHSGTPLQHAAETSSLVVLGVCVVLLAVAGRAWARAGIPWQSIGRTAAIGLIALAALSALVFGDRLTRRRAYVAPAAEFVDFVQQPFVHRAAIAFNNDARAETATLIGARVEPQQLRAGDAFTLTLTWSAGISAPLELVQELPSASEALAIFRHGRARSPVLSATSVHTMPAEALPGPTLLMLTPVDGWNTALTQAFVAGKNSAGVTLIGPSVTGTPRNAPAAHLAEFANGIRAHALDWLRPDGESVCFRAQWSRAGDGAVNRADALQVSFKLFGADDRLIAQADSQPQSGLAPTWSWQDGVLVHDSRCVRVIDPKNQLKQGEAYRLNMTWYRLANLAVTGQADVTGIANMSDGALNEPGK